VGFHLVYVLLHFHFPTALDLNYESLKKVFCLTGWCITLWSDPVSTMRNSCELNALDSYESRLRSTVCYLHADRNKNQLRWGFLRHCFIVQSVLLSLRYL
jgi:hypothetical protein